MLAYLPSPSQGVWHLGPFPLRGYALCIIAGVVVAVWLGDRRWVARGGRPGAVGDLAVWAVPFGLVGGRLYHVLTEPELYFGAGKDPITALYVWRGGLGVWGAIALGFLGGYLSCRQQGISWRAMADTLAPGIAFAQAIGRFGNWFNQELYGRPTNLPWSLEIDPAHRVGLPARYRQDETFHPTFLYEAIWDVGTGALVIWAERRFRLGYGRAFALYVMGYTVGRIWIEALRIDPANRILGLRLNVWTCVVLFLAALAYFVVVGRRHPTTDADVYPMRVEPAPDGTADEDDAQMDLAREDGDTDVGDVGDRDAEGESADSGDPEPDRPDSDPPDPDAATGRHRGASPAGEP